MRKVLFIIGTLAEADIDWLVQIGSRRTIDPGTVLIHQGKPADGLYIVLDGELSVVTEAPVRRELARIGCGEIVGELSFLDARPPSATVAAVTRSQVLAIPRADLLAKLKKDVAFAARFYQALGVLLAYRLRNNQGYKEGAALSEAASYDDELDPTLLDHVAVAGARFDWMLKRLG